MILKKIVPIFVAYLLQNNGVIAMDRQPQAEESDKMIVNFNHLEGHTGPVNCLKIGTLPDDNRHKVLISGSDDGDIRVWDTKTGLCLHILEGHTGPVNFLEIGSVNKNKAFKIVTSDLFDDPTKTGYFNKIKIWNSETKSYDYMIDEWIGSPNDQNLALYIISGSSDNTIRVWDLATGECCAVLEGHSAPIIKITNTLYEHFASLSDDGQIIIWNLSTLQKVASFKHDNACFMLNICAQLVTASKDTIKIWDVGYNLWDCNTQRCIDTLKTTNTIRNLKKLIAVIGSINISQNGRSHLLIGMADSDVSETFYEVWTLNGSAVRSFPENCGFSKCNLKRGGPIKMLINNSNASFELYNYVTAQTIWRGLFDACKPPACYVTFNGHIAYGSHKSNDLMVSQDPVLPQ